jgi:hypothetical protein
MNTFRPCVGLVLGVLACCPVLFAEVVPQKQESVFFPSALVDRVRRNADRHEWGRTIKRQLVRDAAPWMQYDDERLWHLMFGPTIERSWMVWSNGHCPACKTSVPMYNWKMDALAEPWKVRCPHCRESFPKNDFHAFYRSGLDAHGVFDPALAGRSLLFNADHPDADDPLHRFGIDDGQGYVEGDKRWRFIGAYLVYGQWKQAIVAGIRNLAAAYVITGDPAYAHKAGVLLDRVADLYPTHDFGKQGWVYERRADRGYVSTWHDACVETRELIVAYDQIFPAIRKDDGLQAFLHEKALKYNLDNPKASFADIQRNIEQRILQDCITHRSKIRSNYPQTNVTIAFAHTVLGWPHNRTDVYNMIDDTIAKAVAVDGVTGEKGLHGYGAYAVKGIAQFLAQYARIDPEFLPSIFKRQPKLNQTFRFHIDTWCLQSYYPSCGDAGSFAQRYPYYAGATFTKRPGLAPSMFTFFKQLHDLTGDDAYVQVLYRANGGTLDGLPHDLSADDPSVFQKEIKRVINRAGTEIKLGSVNKTEWHIAILRAGAGQHERALWLDYDSGGGHSHADGMQLGLFARGLDLLPDFGYPPVQYGGWGAPRSKWYTMTAAHNTVVVDRKDTRGGGGRTTLWADGEMLKGVRASAPRLIEGKQYERTAAMVSISDEDFYVVDIFRVVGGKEHLKFTRSHFGEITARNVADRRPLDYGGNAQMRNTRGGPVSPGWSADWTVDDRRSYRSDDEKLHLKYIDLTANAEAYAGDTWISVTGFTGSDETWIPHVVTRRAARDAPLSSAFVGVIEPYEKTSRIRHIGRLAVTTAADATSFGDACVGLRIDLTDGRRDYLLAPDVENPLNVQPSFAAIRDMAFGDEQLVLRTDAQLCVVRVDADRNIRRVCLCKGSYLKAEDKSVLRLKSEVDYFEVIFEKGRPEVVSGNPGDLSESNTPERGR